MKENIKKFDMNNMPIDHSFIQRSYELQLAELPTD